MKKKFKTTITVFCEEKNHRVSFTKKGKMVFHDHPQGFKKESFLDFLGGDPCECYRTLLAWRRLNKNRKKYNKKNITHIFPIKFTKELDLILSQNDALREKRKKTRLAPVLERKTIIFEYKKKRAIGEILKRCGFDKYLQYGHLCGILKDSCGTEAYKSFAYIKNILFSLDKKWYFEIYLKGFAIIDECFVIDIRFDKITKHIIFEALKPANKWFLSPHIIIAQQSPGREWIVSPSKLHEKSSVMGIQSNLFWELRSNSTYKKRIMQEKQYRINCGGEKHLVGINANGQIYFKNHDKSFLTVEKTVNKLGGETNKCYKRFEELVKHGPLQYDRAMSKFFGTPIINDDLMTSLSRYRQTLKENTSTTLNVKVIFRLFILKAMEKEINRCKNAKLKLGFAIKEYYPEKYPSFILDEVQHILFLRLPESIEDWYRNVYKKGLARISGCFVGKVEQEDDGTIYAYVLPNSASSSLVYFQKVLVKGSPGNHWFVSV